jgi:hypothetical protein
MPDNYTTMEKLDMCGDFLDKLSEAKGRAKCGYIYIMNEFLESIRKDFKALEENIQNGIEIEPVEVPIEEANTK